MKVKILLMTLALLMGSACSSKKAEKENSGVNTMDVANDASDFVVDSEEDDLFIDEGSENQPDEEIAAAPEEAPEMEMAATGEMKQYTVAQGETLMVIAFKLFGDYRKWKNLKAWNPSINEFSLSAGDSLEYEVPTDIFTWSPNGNPYLIKGGDTLGTISTDKYGTDKKWRDLWENNKPMIRDPNLIFAGFTIYYVSDDVAIQ